MIVRLPDVTPPTFKLAGLQKNATGNWTLSFPSIMADKFKNHPGLASKWTSVVEAIYKKYGKPIGSTPQRDDGQGPHEQDDDPEASALPGIDLSYMAPPIITAKTEGDHSDIREASSFQDADIEFKSSIAGTKHVEVMITHENGVRAVWLVGLQSMPTPTYVVPASTHLFGFGAGTWCNDAAEALEYKFTADTDRVEVLYSDKSRKLMMFCNLFYETFKLGFKCRVQYHDTSQLVRDTGGIVPHRSTIQQKVVCAFKPTPDLVDASGSRRDLKAKPLSIAEAGGLFHTDLANLPTVDAVTMWQVEVKPSTSDPSSKTVKPVKIGCSTSRSIEVIRQKAVLVV